MIYILTSPVGCGKSTLLQNWVKSNPKVHFSGFISVHNRHLNQPRKLLLLPKAIEIPFESEIGEIHVGKFQFLASAFTEGLLQLEQSHAGSTAIIDEIGKLEIENHGFEPQLTKILHQIQFEHLIVVVRLSLLELVIQKYPILKNAQVNQGPWFPCRSKVYGLVLGGGNSSRMGKPKCFLNYHGVPQFIHVSNMMLEVIDGEVFVNVPTALATEIDSAKVLLDSTKFMGKGPISGLLTAHEEVSEASWMVVGVDYPSLTEVQLKELFTAHQVSGRSVCFLNPSNGFLEPLVAIYSASDLKKLSLYFEEGNESLRHFLGGSDVLILPMANGEILTSIDHPAQAEKYQSQISTK